MTALCGRRGGGEYRCEGAEEKHSLKHSNSSFVIFVRWTVNGVMTTWKASEVTQFWVLRAGEGA